MRYAAIGAAWFEDSSLEKWFPLSQDSLNHFSAGYYGIQAQIVALEKAWMSDAASVDKQADDHADKWGKGNDIYCELKERARTLRECAKAIGQLKKFGETA
jgi:hypothetical protein